MSATKHATDLAFIAVTAANGTTPEARKLIRSHVMRGKRWRKKPRGTRTEASADAVKGSDSATAAIEQHFRLLKALQYGIPNKVGSDLSFIQFADHIEPCAFADFVRFSIASKRILFPLEARVVFQHPAKAWVETLGVDAAYVNAAVFMTKLYRDLVSGCQPRTAGQGGVQQLQKALRLLRERLSASDQEAMVSDATTMIVVILAMHAQMVGDQEFARHHVKGLHRIIDLRGGISSFEAGNTKLLIESLRCDLGVALHTGAKPVFFSDGQFIPYPNLSLPLPLDSTGMRSREHNAQILLYGIDGELAQVWRLMKHFCTLINLATATKRQITKETLLETMASVMYRLLYMSFPSGSTSEMVRLGLLAFSSHIFLQWLDIKLSYRHFHASYRKCLKGMETLNVLPPSIMLWLLMIGAISVFTEADDERLELSLRRYILLCEGEPWSRVRVILKRFLWIDCLHDKQGKAIINSLWS